MLKMSLRVEGKPLGGGGLAVDQAVSAFLRDAGTAMVREVRSVLGTAEIYTLSERYSAQKVAGRTRPKMRRVAGKASDQPLILTGEMYRGVKATVEGRQVVVQVEDGVAMHGGFDIAEY